MTDHLDTLEEMRRYAIDEQQPPERIAALDAAIAAMEVGRVCPICGNAAHYKCDKCGEEYFTGTSSLRRSTASRCAW